ncbi:TIGR03089 family protein [Nesterenkonia aurantiaca]|uniref:TIGR03089 family protein n=1 Tax=Nesterenkonia aurantiaca TaxID=1436010 RepID=UPI003EE73ABD
MTPITLGGSAAQAPQNFPALLDLLESRPQPALIWYGAGENQERVELSGRVLQNWAVKLIGLFSQETEIDEDAPVLVDAAPHWKAAAVLLAAGALGWRTTLSASAAAQDNAEALVSLVSGLEPGLIITDRPGAWTGAGPMASGLGEAELAALSPGLLDASFEESTGERLPAWALDISAEVRQHPDQLPAPLPPLALPGATTGAESGAAAGGGLVVVGAAIETSLKDWRLAHWAGEELFAQMLQTWAQSRPVVLFQGDPAAQPEAWEQMLRNEGVS